MSASGITADHARAGELLPWLINGRLQGEELHWLHAHLAQCPLCRTEHLAQRRVRDALASESVVEYAPAAAYNRLWARIEADAAMPLAQPSQPGVAPRRVRPLLVAGLAAQSIAIGILTLVLWQSRGVDAAGNYRTVTTSASAPAGASLLVIFDDAATLAAQRALLGRAGLKLQDGPTVSGVYTLVRDARHAAEPLDLALPLLRSDPAVRFAEPGTTP